MKIRYPIIICISLQLLVIIADHTGLYGLYFLLQDIEGFAIILTFLYAVFVFVRYIFRAIKGAVTGTPAGDYRGEAQRACEKVTPKRKQNVTPPWEQ